MKSTEKGSAINSIFFTLTRRGVTVSEVINLNDIVSAFLKTPLFEKITSNHPMVTSGQNCEEGLLNIKGSPVHLDKDFDESGVECGRVDTRRGRGHRPDRESLPGQTG